MKSARFLTILLWLLTTWVDIEGQSPDVPTTFFTILSAMNGEPTPGSGTSPTTTSSGEEDTTGAENGRLAMTPDDNKQGANTETWYQSATLLITVLEDTPPEGRDATTPDAGENELVLPTWSWLPMSWRWWTIVQMIMALLGIVGNGFVIAVLFKRRASSRSTDRLIGALASADLFTSIFMIPLPHASRVPQSWLGETYCKVVFTSMFMWVSVDASIFTLTLIPIDRYLAITYPFIFRQLLSRQKVSLCITFIWIFAFLLNFFLFFISTVDSNRHQCSVVFPSYLMQVVIGGILCFLQFVIPTILSLTLQALTAYELHKQSKKFLSYDNRPQGSNPSARHLAAKKRVLQMLFLVVLLYIVSWGPSQLVYFTYNLGFMPEGYPYSPLNRCLVILSFLNSCVNPFIYAARYPAFRQAVRELFTTSSTESLFDDKHDKM